jgi:cytidine deaminase
MNSLDEMITLARRAMRNAHAPYSRFSVGVCLRAESGRLYAGCNVENAAYPQGQCAETSAIGAMVTAGDKRIAEVVVLGSGEALCTPCGGCRQRLIEFAGPETPIHMGNDSGVRKTMTLAELTPLFFGPQNLGR